MELILSIYSLKIKYILSNGRNSHTSGESGRPHITFAVNKVWLSDNMSYMPLLQSNLCVEKRAACQYVLHMV